MSIEVSCGQCFGRLLVEVSGAVVACPHCGAHLSTREAVTDGPSFADGIPDNVHDDSHNEPSTTSGNATLIAQGNVDPGHPVDISIRPAAKSDHPDFKWMSDSDTPVPEDAGQGVSVAISDFRSENPFVPQNSADGEPDESATTNFHFDVGGESDGGASRVKSASRPPNPSIPAAIDNSSELAAASSAATSPSMTSSGSPAFSEIPASARAAAFAKDDSDSRLSWLSMLLIVVSTYASLLTIYVIYSTLFNRTHQLESLPDLKTVQQRKGRAVVPSPKNEVPPGHELKLGQTGRFGEIRVTPLRVTRGPLSFTHFTGDPTRERQGSDPVLKLWLKFENVSNQKTITPIDSTLMYFHRGTDDAIAYNVIFSRADRYHQKGRFFYHFGRIAADSEWLIVGQNANRALAPHEQYETFVPSEENIDELSGDLVWRVHIRKGYGPQSGNGVTTLIDVRFHSDQIKPDSV